MTAGGRRLFAALAILLLPVGAAAEVRFTPSDAPGRERERFVDPAPPRAQPGGDSISLPSTVAPEGAERITLTISRVAVTGATVYSDADLAPLYADMMGAEISLAAVYDLARRITAKYGAAGYVLPNVAQQLIPSSATLQVQNAASYTWLSSTSDPRALQIPGGSGGIASTWYSTGSFSFNVKSTSSTRIAIYALD